jgi:hypothetical protein
MVIGALVIALISEFTAIHYRKLWSYSERLYIVKEPILSSTGYMNLIVSRSFRSRHQIYVSVHVF